MNAKINPQNLFGLENMNTLTLNESEILIVGGISGKDNFPSNNISLFSTINNSVVQINESILKNTKVCPILYYQNEELFCIGGNNFFSSEFSYLKKLSFNNNNNT